MSADATAAERLPFPPGIRRRLFLVALVVAVFGVGMTVFLNYFKFQTAVEAAARSRILLLAGNVDDGVQGALAIGLPLGAIPALPELLARERAADPAILSIGIFDPAGRMLYSTDTAARGHDVPPAWLAAARHAGADSWQLADGASAVVGLALRNSFELELGQVAIRYSRSGIAAALAGMRRDLAATALWGVIGTVLLAVLALRLALGSAAHLERT
jgi:hypothetical protein